MITIRQIGNLKNTERFFSNAQKFAVQDILKRYADKGVYALSLATPKDTGMTASSWTYSIFVSRGRYAIYWINTHEENGISPAILIQYGHGTRGGTYVPGIDYINPAMRPILEGIAEDIWKEVSKL